MDFSPQQDNALVASDDWFKDARRGRAPQVFRLFGYAGTGKTTLAQHLAENIDGDVLFAAFTGKAAQVLRARGAGSARTIHSLIYRPRGEETVEDEETGKTVVSPAFSLNRASPLAKAALVIIDECSMVDEALGRDLLSFGVPVLVLGDPGQLPPVTKGEGEGTGAGFFTEHEPDVLLTEVHRQARDNPIIAMSMDVREGRDLMIGSYGPGASVISRRDIDQDEVLAADQVLVGINRTRRLYNQRLRALNGFGGPLPAAGDRLVCLRNDNAKGLLNGGLWSVTSVGAARGAAISLLVKPEDDGRFANNTKIKVLKSDFEAPDKQVPWPQRRRHDQFDFGYVLTVHKAQGSQWDSIVLFDESRAFRDHRTRWLYTGITRAAERIIVVR